MARFIYRLVYCKSDTIKEMLPQFMINGCLLIFVKI